MFFASLGGLGIRYRPRRGFNGNLRHGGVAVTDPERLEAIRDMEQHSIHGEMGRVTKVVAILRDTVAAEHNRFIDNGPAVVRSERRDFEHEEKTHWKFIAT